MSADELTMYYGALPYGTPPAGVRASRGARVFVARRASDEEPFSSFERLRELEPSGADAVALRGWSVLPSWISQDGCVLYFDAAPPEDTTGFGAVYRTTRAR